LPGVPLQDPGKKENDMDHIDPAQVGHKPEAVREHLPNRRASVVTRQWAFDERAGRAVLKAGLSGDGGTGGHKFFKGFVVSLKGKGGNPDAWQIGQPPIIIGPIKGEVHGGERHRFALLWCCCWHFLGAP
jgi:hypothetical protein